MLTHLRAHPTTKVVRAYHAVLAAFALAICAAMGTSAWARQPDNDPPKPPSTQDQPAAPRQPVAGFVIVEGQVTDHIGAGQSGVTIVVQRKKNKDAEGEVIATSTTNEFGDFAVTSSRPVRGDVVVTMSKPLYEDSTRELHLDGDGLPPFLAETLAGKLVVVGRVVDSLAGQPITGALITLLATYKDWHEKTDDQGRFTIKGVFPGKGELIVEAEGFGRQRQPLDRLEDVGVLLVSLKPERIVHVKLLDDLGKPIIGATVECYDEPRDDFRTGVTDAGGRVKFQGLHFDATLLSLRLTHEDYVSSEGFDRELVATDDEAESSHQLVMARAGRITGRITHAETGDPLNGARVMTGSDYSDTSPRDWADYRGRYTVNGVRPGSTVVTVHLGWFAPELKTVDVKAGEAARLDVRLSPGAVVTGTVKNERGEPLSGILVTSTQWRGKNTLGLRALTGPDGSFVIENAPHDEFEITVYSERGTGARIPSRTVAPVTQMVKAKRDTTIEITLTGVQAGSDHVATGRLRLGDAAPALNVTTLTGETLKLADMKGKTILLDFWATWCVPCVAELPHFVAVNEKFGARKDFVMISVSLDGDEKTLRDFVKERKMKWHNVFGDAGGAQKAAERYGVGALPSVFLIASDGKIVGLDLHADGLLEKVEQVLKRNDPT